MRMRTHTARVSEIGWETGGRTAWIDCPPAGHPAPGRYVLAWSPEDAAAPLATPLFAMHYAEGRFQAAPPAPVAWDPGAPLLLRGPLGHGFTPPPNLRRLALVGLDVTIARLLPLLFDALSKGAAVALFTEAALPSLPTSVEVSPLAALPEALAWADYLAADLPETALPGLRVCLGVDAATTRLPCPAQGLVRTSMPCGGIAACEACGVNTRHGSRPACADGPVFDLVELL